MGTIRITELDVPLAADVARLWRRCFPCRELHLHIAWNPGGRPFSRNSIGQRILQKPDFDPAGSFVAVTGGKVVGFCLAAMKTGKRVTDGYLSAICVAPRHRRQGLGTELLRNAEAWLRQRGATTVLTAHEGNPIPLLYGVPLDAAALPFLLSNGYRSYDRHFMQVMAQDTAAFTLSPAIRKIPRALAARGIRISYAERPDRDAVIQFAGKHFPSWRQGLADNFAGDSPKPVLVAVRQGAILGFAGPFHVSRIHTGHFGCIGVDPGARGLGIGAVLFNRMCEELKAGGATVTHLTTNLDNPAQDIYARAGYRARCVVDCGMKKTAQGGRSRALTSSAPTKQGRNSVP